MVIFAFIEKLINRGCTFYYNLFYFILLLNNFSPLFFFFPAIFLIWFDFCLLFFFLIQHFCLLPLFFLFAFLYWFSTTVNLTEPVRFLSFSSSPSVLLFVQLGRRAFCFFFLHFFISFSFLFSFFLFLHSPCCIFLDCPGWRCMGLLSLYLSLPSRSHF